MKYIKISEDYFLNCIFPSRHCHKKALCLDPNYHWTHRAQYNHKYELKTVRDVVEYFKQDGTIEKAKSSNGSEVELTDREKGMLNNAVRKQKDFMNGDVKKSRMSKMLLNILKKMVQLKKLNLY